MSVHPCVLLRVDFRSGGCSLVRWNAARQGLGSRIACPPHHHHHHVFLYPGPDECSWETVTRGAPGAEDTWKHAPSPDLHLLGTLVHNQTSF